MCMGLLWDSFKVKQTPKRRPLSRLPICLKSLNTVSLPFCLNHDTKDKQQCSAPNECEMVK
jgi:hypothetical protein